MVSLSPDPLPLITPLPGTLLQKQVALSLKRLKVQEDRITDAYINEAMELDRYKVEMEKLRVRRRELERAAKDIERMEQQEANSRDALEHLERFCGRVSDGLAAMTFEERQRLLRLVVERVTVEAGRVRIETVIPTGDDDAQLRARRGEPVEPWRPIASLYIYRHQAARLTPHFAGSSISPDQSCPLSV